MTQAQSDGRSTQGKIWGKGQNSRTLSQHAALPKSPHVHPPGSSANPLLWGF